jgi:hypothetical protein
MSLPKNSTPYSQGKALYQDVGYGLRRASSQSAQTSRRTYGMLGSGFDFWAIRAVPVCIQQRYI